MANIKFSRKEFEKHIKITPKIEEQIHMFGTPLESLTKDEVEIEIFPNRPDMLSMHGFLRGFLGFLGKQKGLKKYNVKKSGYKLVVDSSLPKEWPYAVACIVKGIKFDDEKIKEVIDIQEKLGMTMLRKRKKGGIGLYPLEKINFPVKFVGMDPNKIKFVPLESNREMTGKQILSGHPTGRDYAYICSRWNKFPVFIDDKGKIMSMPPIINSHTMGKVDEKTKEVFIEATGPNLNIIKKALNIIVTALADMGGEIYSIDCIQQNKKPINIPDLTPEKISINIKNVNKLLGLDLKETDVKGLLEKMGYNYNKGEVEIPAWRIDILHEHDIIEDIAIAYGYQNFTPEIPEVATIGQEDKTEATKRKISEILQGLNMLETSSFHLTTPDAQFKKVNKKKENIIEVEESKTEYSILRHDLLHYALKILSENSDAEYPQRIFELGRVFSLDKKSSTGISEKEDLCVCTASPSSNFTEIKQTLDYLMRMLDKNYKIEPTMNSYFIDGRCGKIIVDEKEIGFIGEICPNILSNLKIKMPVSGFELDIHQIVS